MGKSDLLLLKYQVDTISFSLNEKFDFDSKKSVKLNQKFSRSIDKIDDNHCKVSLSFSVNDSEDNPTPFELNVQISGIFKLDNWEEDDRSVFINTNAVAILYPFVRSLVATLTANANVPAYVLPVFNIVAWFEENNK